jgi:hypothetical protein
MWPALPHFPINSGRKFVAAALRGPLEVVVVERAVAGVPEQGVEAGIEVEVVIEVEVGRTILLGLVVIEAK